jgi:hypothetical protein
MAPVLSFLEVRHRVEENVKEKFKVTRTCHVFWMELHAATR